MDAQNSHAEGDVIVVTAELHCVGLGFVTRGGGAEGVDNECEVGPRERDEREWRERS
jgi:hypothetical protein